MGRIGHKQRILEHLLKTGKITTMEAIRKYGNTRLSEYIRELRADGYSITSNWTTSKNRFGDNTRYVIYTLERN